MNKKAFKLLTAKTGLDDFHYLFTYHVAEVSFKQHIKVFIYTNDSLYIQVMSEYHSRYWMEATCRYPVGSCHIEKNFLTDSWFSI